MDEPTAALGPAETAQVRNLVRQLKDEGIGIFLISHDIHDVFDLSDRISVMYHGRIVGHGRTRTRSTADDVLGDDHPRQEAGRGHREGAGRDRAARLSRGLAARRGRSAAYSRGNVRRKRRVQLAIDRVALGVDAPRRAPVHATGVTRTTASAAASTVANQPAPTAARSAGAVGRALGRLDRRDLGAEDVGEDLAPERARGPAARRADLRRRAASRPRSSGRGRRAARRRRPRAPPGSGGAGRGRGSARRTRRARAGPGCGLRSPVRYGRKNRPSLPGGTAAAVVDEVAERRRPAPACRGTSAGCPPPTASPTSCASGRARRGRTRGRGRAGSWNGRSVAAKTTPDVPSDRAIVPGDDDPDADRVGRLVAAAGDDRRPGPQPGRRGRRGADDAGDLGSLERRWQPRRIDAERVEDLGRPVAGRQVEQERARRRRPCRARARRSAAAGRSPWAAGRGRRGARPPARGRGPRRASAP